jgi:hypothetical protein
MGDSNSENTIKYINQSTQLNLKSDENTTKVVVNTDNTVALNTTCDILTFSKVKVQGDIDIKNHTRAGIDPDEENFTAPEYRKAGSTISEYLKAFSTFDPATILTNIMTFDASFNIFGLAVPGIKGSNYMDAVFEIAKTGLFVSETRQSDDTHHPNAKLAHDLNDAMMTLGGIGANLTAGVEGFDEEGYTTQNAVVTAAYNALMTGLQTNYVKLYKSFAAFQRRESMNENGIPEYLAISNEFVVVILDDIPVTSDGVYVNPVTQVRQSEPGTFESAILVNIATTVAKTIPGVDGAADTTRIITAGVGKEFNELFQEIEDLFAVRRKEREKILNENTLGNVYDATGILINDLQVGATDHAYTITRLDDVPDRTFAVKMSSESEIELLMELTGDGVSALVVGNSITLAEMHEPALDENANHPVTDFQTAAGNFEVLLEGATDQARYKKVEGETITSLEAAYTQYKTAHDLTTIKMHVNDYKTPRAILQFDIASDTQKQINYQAVRQIGPNQQMGYKTTHDADDDNFTEKSSFLNLSSSSLTDICQQLKTSFNQDGYTAATPFSASTIGDEIDALQNAYKDYEDEINDLSVNVNTRFKTDFETVMETYADTQAIKATATAEAGEVRLDTVHTVTQASADSNSVNIHNTSAKYNALLDGIQDEIDSIAGSSTDESGSVSYGVLRSVYATGNTKTSEFNDHINGISGGTKGVKDTLGDLHRSTEQRLIAIRLIADAFMNVFGFTKEELVTIMNTKVDGDGADLALTFYLDDGVLAGPGVLNETVKIDSDTGDIVVSDKLTDLLNYTDSYGDTGFVNTGASYPYTAVVFDDHVSPVPPVSDNIFNKRDLGITTSGYERLYQAESAS